MEETFEIIESVEEECVSPAEFYDKVHDVHPNYIDRASSVTAGPPLVGVTMSASVPCLSSGSGHVTPSVPGELVRVTPSVPVELVDSPECALPRATLPVSTIPAMKAAPPQIIFPSSEVLRMRAQAGNVSR